MAGVTCSLCGNQRGPKIRVGSRWPRSGLYAMLTHFGEVFIEWRIAAWVKAGAVEQVETGPSETSRYTRAWRLTALGHEIPRQRLESRRRRARAASQRVLVAARALVLLHRAQGVALRAVPVT